MASSEIKIALNNAASWKIKVLNAVLKVLNWLTIPRFERNKRDITINVRFDVE